MGEYLSAMKGAPYRDQVFDYIEAEDTSRPLAWELDQLGGAGFRTIEVLHKNTCFAAFGSVK
jgi:tRNA (cmo5U34)-methyltransferase